MFYLHSPQSPQSRVLKRTGTTFSKLSLSVYLHPIYGPSSSFSPVSHYASLYIVFVLHVSSATSFMQSSCNSKSQAKNSESWVHVPVFLIPTFPLVSLPPVCHTFLFVFSSIWPCLVSWFGCGSRRGDPVCCFLTPATIIGKRLINLTCLSTSVLPRFQFYYKFLHVLFKSTDISTCKTTI